MGEKPRGSIYPPGTTETPTPARETLATFTSIKVPFDKVWLADASDVDRYLEAMRKALLVEISNGKKIQI
jgi:hypothetical protein